ncbi:MAG TPA: FAD-dependent monooxygenase [Ottowia sp.]|uniref:FAD-dependent monooxygenase n=1 Tax=Ottowia sp. TaxID=1898956 RepID=UPI002B79029F|nr:FAD-dependent monooxygenase [Ottowia sp.]HMN20725.1 FAD-dependent monooxygenase [Ottowia sp.]
MSATQQLLVAGGGIAAMAAACAVARAGWEVRVYERAPVFAEVGAGLQLGPNVTRVLRAWGLDEDLRAVAAYPERLVVRSAPSGAELGVLPLASRAEHRYGAPYASIHRADLHALLVRGCERTGRVQLNLGQTLTGFREQGDAVRVQLGRQEVEGDALLGADGLLSSVRAQLLGDGPPEPVGDLAYRGMLDMARLPASLRANQVTVWLGPALHVVQYPVRGGAALNVVAIVRGRAPAQGGDLDVPARAQAELERALQGLCAPLHELIAAAPAASLNDQPWRRWVLAARPPVSGADQMARGLVALAGDAAHPMRPYMAQGAGMAIEDAAELGHALAMDAVEVRTRLRRYALARWQRCARVQERSRRNGEVFHARGLVRVGRDASIRLFGERLLDVPWLYGL